MLGRGLGRTRVSPACSGAQPTEASAPACSGLCPASQRLSRGQSEDRRCPQLLDEPAEWPRGPHALHTSARNPRGAGDPRSSGGIRGQGPCPSGPGHGGSHGHCGWRPTDSSALGTAHRALSKPWLPSESTFQAPQRLSRLRLQLQAHPSPILTCSVGSGKRPRPGKTEGQRGKLVARRTSESHASLRQPLALTRDPLRLYLYGVKSLWFILEFYVVGGGGETFFSPGCVIISLTF